MNHYSPHSQFSESKDFRIAIVAGEVSGDKLGAELMDAIEESYPDVIFEGIGGERMQRQNFTNLFPMERLSVMGIGAILSRLPELIKIRKSLFKRWKNNRIPDLFIGIDAPEFNIGLALKLKSAQIKTLHYVSPSVWAWRPKRIFKIKKAIDHMLTLFPFENEIYQQHFMNVTCVGHPMAAQIPFQVDVEQAKSNIAIVGNNPLLALLPGSRVSEIKFLAPLFFAVANEILKVKPDLTLIVPIANERCRYYIELAMTTSMKDKIVFIESNSTDAIACADVVLLASGTATLETALLKKPMVMAYKVSSFSYALFSFLSVLKYYSLPNLLLNEALVPEFLQKRASLKNLTQAVLTQFNLNQQQMDRLNQKYLKIHRILNQGGSHEAARVVINMLTTIDSNNSTPVNEESK